MRSPKKIKRVLLIHPPGNRVIRANGERGLKAATQPLGLAYIASVLRERKYEVMILDCIAEGYGEPELEVEPEIFRYGLNDGQIAVIIQDVNPDIVGISCPQAVRQPEADHVASISKAVFPDVLVIMGGASPSALKQEIMAKGDVDFIVQGEGEERFCELLEALQDASLSLHKVDGLIYRDGNRVIVNEAKRIIQNIDALPLPAYDLLPMEKYFSIGRNPSVYSASGNTSIMISSRGCAMQCYYCPVHNVFGPTGPSFRMRAVENILEEIELLVTKYNVREIQFEDSNFNASPTRTIDLSKALGKSFPGLRWCTPHGNQVSTLTDHVLEAMREGGCYSLHLAIESGNQIFLDKRKKGLKLTRLRRILKRARDLGFQINTFFMIGYPEETTADIQNTIDFAQMLDLDDVHFFIATPFPGTKMYEICRDRGWLIPNRSWRHFRYSTGIIKTDNFDPSYLQSVRRESWLKLRAANNNRINICETEKDIYG